MKKDYLKIDKFISNFDYLSFSNQKNTENYLKFFNLKKMLIDQSKKVNPNFSFQPNFNDLARIHFLILKRKVINCLEFGSGFSTLVIGHAMSILSLEYEKFVKKNFRVEKPFNVFSIEESKDSMIDTKKISKEYSNFINLKASPVNLILHDNRIASIYKNLFDINPDLIFLDGPSLNSTKDKINNISYNKVFRMPISADILRYEFFLEPGCLILVDGRTTNSVFLKNYLKRNWIYKRDKIGDVHYFELKEDPIGELNKKKMKFCLNNEWLISN